MADTAEKTDKVAEDEPPSAQAHTYDVPSSKLQKITRGERKPGMIAAYLSLVHHKHRLIPAVWILGLTQFAPVWIFPILTAYAVDLLKVDATRMTAVAALKWILPAVCALVLINILVALWRNYLLSVQRRSLTAGLRRALMRQLYRLTFAFHDKARAGELQNKFLYDLGRIEHMQGYLAEHILMQGTSIVAMLVVICVYVQDPVLLAIIISVAPINALLVTALWKKMRMRSEESRKAENNFVAFLHEAIHGLRLTRAHAIEDRIGNRLGAIAGNVADVGVKADAVNALFGSLSWALSQTLNMAVFGVGVWRCARGSISIGDLLLFMSYYGMTYSSIAAIVGGFPIIIGAKDAINSLSELYHADQEERNDGKPALPSVRGDVLLKDVTFAYAGSENHSLCNLSLEIPAGQSLALVGHSGSGKSTVASMILGLYQPKSGTVLIDGHDLSAIDRRSVRRFVGVVSQEMVLFQDTVLGNIAWGDDKPDEARARAAAVAANAADFITKLPQGYHTLLGDKGIGLSGGQRQRVAIARAIYRDPKLLILDEATSALDPESERQVQAALEVLMKGRTTIIIAHRLSTVRCADRIAVLEGGQLAELGKFDELMEKKEAFYRMAHGQLV
jgi:ATP-binding cassette subfamily B protein